MIKVQQQIKGGRARAALLACIGLFAFALVGGFVWTTEWRSVERPRPVGTPAGKTRPSNDNSSIRAIDDGSDSSPERIGFLLDRVKHDPDDFLVQNMVASAMLLRVRETGNADYLERAKSAAAMSLSLRPAAAPSVKWVS